MTYNDAETDFITEEVDGPATIFHARSERARAWVVAHAAEWWVEEPPAPRIVIEPERAHLVADRLQADGLTTVEWIEQEEQVNRAGATESDFHEGPDTGARADSGVERELTHDEHIALLKERNAKAREAINALVAENAQLRAELGR
jgi:hypothetical protein